MRVIGGGGGGMHMSHPPRTCAVKRHDADMMAATSQTAKTVGGCNLASRQQSQPHPTAPHPTYPSGMIDRLVTDTTTGAGMGGGAGIELGVTWSVQRVHSATDMAGGSGDRHAPTTPMQALTTT